MPAFCGYLASVTFLLSAFMLGAMKLLQPDPAPVPPAVIAHKAAPAPAKAALSATKRKPPAAAGKQSHVAALRHGLKLHRRKQPDLPREFHAGSGDEPGQRNLGYAAEPAPTSFNRRFR